MKQIRSRERSAMVPDFIILATFLYAQHRKAGKKEGEAKSDAVWLASVIGSQKAGGWTGGKTTARKTPQVIASRVFVRDGQTVEQKMFGGKVMNARAFTKLVVDRAWPHYPQLSKRVMELVAQGVEFNDIRTKINTEFS